VTNFELKTIPAPAVGLGQTAYNTTDAVTFLDSVYAFAFDGILDQKAAITPTVSISESQGLTYTSYVFYNAESSNGTATPAAIANFTGDNGIMPPISNTFAYRTMANWSTDSSVGFDQVHGLRFRFHVLSMVASREAMTQIHDIYLEAAKNMTTSVTGFLATLAFMPISESYIVNNRGDVSGDPMGIDATKAPYFWVEESIMWALSSDDAAVEQFIVDVNVKLDAALATLGVAAPYLYLNDADDSQPVFQGYNQDNVARMKTIRDKYDPGMVYTNQMPGGFKVAAV
jgi:hypothetical protein